MRPKLSSLALLMLCACTAVATPVQLRWECELSDPKPYSRAVFRGETVQLTAALKLYGQAVTLPADTSATIYWQTNGMGSAWWSSPAAATADGTLSAIWLPAMDSGAAAYTFYLSADADGARTYRAHGRLSMLPSPGAVPNELPHPVRAIDFAAVTVTNEPWATPADVAAATSGLLRAEADTLATVTARGATTTAAVTIGNRGTGDVGSMSLAQGDGATASGGFSHAEGVSTTASGQASHAEGVFTTASGDSSHAEGYSTTASGQASHAEGVLTTASGPYSHAEGDSTTASGQASHAEGYESEAAGIASHASGFKAYTPDTDHGAFAWQGTDGSFSELQYDSHGPGTYSLNPVGGLAGFWIGETTLDALLDERATWQGATNAAVAVAWIAPDIATNVVYHVVVSNGHWLIREVQ